MAGQLTIKQIAQEVISEVNQPLYIGGIDPLGSDSKLTISSGGVLDLASGSTIGGKSIDAYSDAPCFSATANQITSFSPWTPTKIKFNAEEYDTNNCYDSTNSRFTPSVAGYYLVQVTARILYYTVAEVILQLFKNGSDHKVLSYTNVSQYGSNGSCIVYMNGTTDYIEAYVNASFSDQVEISSNQSYFQAALIRRA